MTDRDAHVRRMLNAILAAHHDLVRRGSDHDDATMHAEVVALVASGRGCHAVSTVARRHAPAVGISAASLANRLRRQIRTSR
jgi:hypothetical protein